MGGDIAALCAIKGMRVTLSDLENTAIAGAIKRAVDTAKEMHLGSAEIRDALDRLIPDPQNEGVAHADLIIEAGPEKADIKEKIYKSLEPHMKNGAVLATNTSSIPLAMLAQKLDYPARFVGIHFFNPVAKLDLVEVVSHDEVSKAAQAIARGFIGQIDKLPALVKSAPGFLVNRSLMPYLLEAILMVDEGIAPETVDRAAENFGMPVGPLELADQVGLDICLSVAGVLREKLDIPVPDVPDWIQNKVDNGELGKKSGRGIYEWKEGKAQKTSSFDDPDEAMQDRLILPMLNACAVCLREGVVDDADTLDAAMIFATGFAPFHGGPICYARNRGFDDVARALGKLEKEHGKRFSADAFWLENSEG
jgi:3-hydroxyacyl-CoA dehydrogenase/enoyl-CoA hydratase/3-hydroxybutyryl-CoA epimerase